MSASQPTVTISTQIASAHQARVTPETPFRILLMGDLSGAAHADPECCVPLMRRRPVWIDVDNAGEVMQRLHATVNLPADLADGASLPLRSLDDFHPDAWITRVEQFGRLRGLRDALLDPSTFARAAAEVRSWATWQEDKSDGPREVAHAESLAPARPPVVPDNLLEQTLEATQPTDEPPAGPSSSPWAAVIRDLVRPYVVPGRPPKQAEMVECVDQATSVLMRALLHAPPVQHLEGAWRSVQFLLRRLTRGTQLKLFLLDVTKQELLTDLTCGAAWTDTALYKIVVEESVGTAGGQPWAVLGGLYDFGATVADAELLTQIARLAQNSGAALVVDAAPGLVGCSSFARTPDPREWQTAMDTKAQHAWQRLRGSPEAHHICLAAPRIMLRLPYGPDTSPVEAFAFEEMPDGPVHEHYLWGHACVACVQALGELYIRDGWQLEPNSRCEIGDVPLHVFDLSGESVFYPPSEAFLTERAISVATAQGLTTLVSLRDRDALHIPGIRSLASGGLAGPWSSG